MADIVDRKTRSRMMSGIRGKNTKPEISIRKGLFALGYRYRLHHPGLPGRPDMLFPKHRAAVFVHGCFWHGHDCPLFRLPGSNTEFWRAKIRANRKRDIRVLRGLADLGWRVLVIWECAFRGGAHSRAAVVCQRAARWLGSGSRTATIRGRR